MQNQDRTLIRRNVVGTVGRKSSEDSVRQSQGFFRLLQDIAVVASATSTPNDALVVALEQLCAFKDWPVGHICLSAAEAEPCLVSSELWHVKATQPFTALRELRHQARFPAGVGLPGRVLATKEPVWITDLTRDDDLRQAEQLQSVGVRGALAFPVLVENDVTAVLEFFSDKEEPADEAILDVLACIGLQLGAIIAGQFTAEKLAAARQSLVETTRRAGTAEIATSALHNVGNVLNSVNVAASTICEKLRQSGTSDLKRAAGMFQEHQHDIATFVSADERGKHLPRFLLELSRRMETDEETVLAELTNLIRNIGHIKDVVSVQQTYSGVSGVEEETTLVELVEDAIRINFASLDRHKIEIVRQFADHPPVVIAKQKFLQIIVNLISNAKYSLIESDTPARRINLRLQCAPNDQARIEVEDNGVGIAAENLTRIFSHGFTTRKKGHGFGLHSAAILARELGGDLKAYSDGPGRGALFVLDIPLKATRVNP